MFPSVTRRGKHVRRVAALERESKRVGPPGSRGLGAGRANQAAPLSAHRFGPHKTKHACAHPARCDAAAMSRSYACNQFERNYKPVRLCNWEVPADRVCTVKPTSTTPPKKTEFIVSDNGHLIGRGQHAQNAPIGSAPARLLQPLGSWPLGKPRGRGRPTGYSSQPPPKPLIPPPLTLQAGRWQPPSSRAMMRCRPTGGPTIGSRAVPHMAAVPPWGSGEAHGGGVLPLRQGGCQLPSYLGSVTRVGRDREGGVGSCPWVKCMKHW